MRISDWSSDVCSSDLANRIAGGRFALDGRSYQLPLNNGANSLHGGTKGFDKHLWTIASVESGPTASVTLTLTSPAGDQGYPGTLDVTVTYRSEEHTSELQSLMRISYAVFCLKKKKNK